MAARGANLDLGTKLAERFHRPKLTKDIARLLALLVLDRDADSYAARGLRYVDPRLQEIEVRELKSGKRKEKITYAERQRCAAHLVERLDRARSADEILGGGAADPDRRPLRGRAGDRQVAPDRLLPARQPRLLLRRHRPALTARREIPTLVEKIAKPVLPRRMRDQLAEREAERREADRQEEVVGRDADEVEVTRGEVVADGEALTDEAKRAFEETAGRETIRLGRSDEGMTRAGAEHEARLIATQILAGTWSPPLKADYVERDVPTIAQLADEHSSARSARDCGRAAWPT